MDLLLSSNEVRIEVRKSYTVHETSLRNEIPLRKEKKKEMAPVRTHRPRTPERFPGLVGLAISGLTEFHPRSIIQYLVYFLNFFKQFRKYSMTFGDMYSTF